MRKLYLSTLAILLTGSAAFSQDPTSPAPTPINAAGDVLSIFSDASGYGANQISTPAVNSFRATATYVTVASDNILKLNYKLDNGTTSGGTVQIVTNYSQTEYNVLDATSYSFFHIDIYNPATGGTTLPTLTLKLVDYGPDGSRTANADNKEGQVTFNTPSPGTWGSFNFAIADFKNGTATPLVSQRANMGGMLITASENSDLYVDNIYFSTVSTLPLKLTSFSGKLSTDGIKLDWTSEAETDFKGYEIERSTDNRVFSGLPGVFVAGGKNTYSYTDKTYTAGNNYYRLKMVDNDGTVNYSPVVGVRADLASDGAVVQFYPNPMENKLHISYSSEKSGDVSISLRDVQGRVVKQVKGQATEGQNSAELNTSDLNSGVYLLQIINNGKNIFTQKIIK